MKRNPSKKPASVGDDDAELPISRTPRVADDVHDELEYHIAERARELEALGVPPDQAMRDARALFGDRSAIEKECADIEKRRRRVHQRAFRMRSLQQDVVVGSRLLRKTPLFTIAAILTLAIGIGANAAVFSLVNQVILQPLPFPNADRIVRISERHEQGYGNLAWSTFAELHETSTSFAAMTSYGTDRVTVLGAATPLRAQAAEVSEKFFDVFGARPERGRLPLPGEHAVGANPVVVVSHAFWRDHLGAPPSLDGVQLRLDVVHDVVGVMPAGFSFPDNADLWMPLERNPQPPSHTAHNWTVAGLLRTGVNPLGAQRELDMQLRSMREIYAADFDALGSIVTPLQDVLTASLKTPLYLLFAASAVLLLAACTNLASAQLARGATRAGELAIRSALGASRLRLIRQLLTESALLAFLGAATGLLVARMLLKMFAIAAPASLHLERVTIDGWVLVFALIVSLVTALGFGLLPALRLSESTANIALREGGRSTVSKRGMRVWNVLVAAEIALAIMLLSGSQVLIRSFANVMQTDLGFDADNVTTAMVNLPVANYPDSSGSAPQFHESVLTRVRATPGIAAVGFANRLPLEGGGPSGAVQIEGKPNGSRGPFNSYAVYRIIGGEYFQAMGMRIVEGRALNAGDDASAPPVVIVDETFAQQEWPGESAIGRRLRPFGMDRLEEPWHTVVGVVASVRTGSITEPFQPTYYFDHRQRPESRSRSASYVVRTATAGAAASAILQREIAAVDAQVPVEAGSMARILADTVADRRFMMLLLGAFAGVALLLAIVGIYAVVSYTVAQRTREIGVRLALGATPAQVLTLVIQSAMRGVIPGLVGGALLAFVSVRALRSLLYGVSPQDPWALLTAVALLGGVGVLSTVIPARRATRVDPRIAMSGE
jgi:predicted permease